MNVEAGQHLGGHIAGHHPDEASIKAAVLAKLLREKRVSRSSVVASEFAIFRSRTRADLAILGRKFLGIEIKSAADSLRRLPNQLATYQSVFDRTILVLAEKHGKSFDTACYPWLEVWIIDNRLRVKVLQSRSEADQLRSSDQYARHLTAADRKTVREITGSTSSKHMFQTGFRCKFTRSSNLFWLSVRDGTISAENVRQLSRFREQRERFVRHVASREAQWERWLHKLQDLQKAPDYQSFQSSSVAYSLAESP